MAAQASAPETAGDGEKPRAPILPAIAYPAAVAYVPWELYRWNAVLSVVVAILWGILLSNDGFNVFAFVIACAIFHAYFAIRFRRDPHIHRIWDAYYFGKPHPAWRGTRTPGPRRRRVNRFIAA